MLNLGDVRANSILYVPFATYNAAGASVTITGLAVTDIEIYKDGSVTQRASDAGYALLDTDGIDFDGITGIHGFSIDLSDNTTAGFYAAGSTYWVVVSAITVDAQTVNFVYYFTIDRMNLTTAQDSKVTKISSKVTQIYSDTTHVDSDTTRIESKAVQIYSDTTAVHTQTTTAASKVVQIYSDTTIVASKVVQIYSDTTAIAAAGGSLTVAQDSKLTRVNSKSTQVYSDTTIIASKSVQIYSDTTAAAAGTSPDVLVDTTIATLSTQTSFTLTAGSADNDVYNGCAAIFTDASTATQKAVAFISDYVGATKTVTLEAAPGFTIATTDHIAIMAAGASTSVPLTATLATAEASQLTRINSKATQVYSDTTITVSKATQIYSDTAITASKAVQVYSDTTIIYSDTTRIHSDTTHIDSDTTHIESDAARVESKSVQIYSDTTAVHSDTTAVQTKTDSLTFTVAGKADANVTHVIADPVVGASAKDTSWGGTA